MLLQLSPDVRKLFRTFVVVAAALAMGACSTARTVDYDEVEIERAEVESDPAALLDVGIVIFDANVPESLEEQEKELIFPEVRKAEARYMPYHLKSTLEQTGHWGSVWVLPERGDTVDVLVMGSIEESNGLDVKVRVGAWDATGREWLNKVYKTEVPEKAYSQYRDLSADPYQNLYNEIANDLLDARRELKTADLIRVREVSELRYASKLLPEAFDDYLKVKGDKYTVRRLPSDDDPMVQRLRAVREREYLLIDTLNEYYAGLYYDLSQPYEDWRKNSRQEALRYEELKRSARMQQILGAAAIIGAIAYEGSGGSNSGITNTAILGGIEVLRSGMGKSAEAKVHQEALRELGISFDMEAEPLVVEVEGQTLRLTGSAEEKYREWRTLLEQIYAAETGFIIDAPASAEPPAISESGSE